jgi:hypothetical protein
VLVNEAGALEEPAALSARRASVTLKTLMTVFLIFISVENMLGSEKQYVSIITVISVIAS